VSVAGTAFSVDPILLLLHLDRFAHNLHPVGVSAIVGRRGRQGIGGPDDR
jgi:hypothetical protein